MRVRSRQSVKEKWGREVFRSFGEKSDSSWNLRPRSYENCDCRQGVLRGGVGMKKCVTSAGEDMTISLSNDLAALNTFFASINSEGLQEDTTSIYILGLDGYLYMRTESGYGWQRISLGTYAFHCALRGENRAIYNFFGGPKGLFATHDGGVFRTISSEKIIGGCICGKRCVVLTSKGDIWYTAVLEPYDTDTQALDKKGVIYAPAACGAPLGIQAYGGNAYVFYEKKIFKVSLFPSEREHTCREIPYFGGTICLRGQATTSEGIIFLASEGIYYLRGDRVERICEYLPVGRCVPDKAVSVGYCDDLVLFAYHRQTPTGSEVKRIAVYSDGKDGYFAEVYAPLGGTQYTFFYGTVYRYVKDAEGTVHGKESSFTSEWLDFGINGKKRLKTLTVKGQGRIKVGVRCGERERIYALDLKEGERTARLFDKGKAFSFTFYLEPGAAVEEVEIRYLTEG